MAPFSLREAAEQAGTSKSTMWRASKAGRFSASRTGGPRLPRRSILIALSGAAVAGPLEHANAALRRRDYATAYALTRPLADQGLAVAQFVLGVMYGGGHGVPQNYAEAAQWYRRAADQGWPEAQTFLGMMYAQGQGVAKNDAEAANWFRKAADQGLAVAQFLLGLIYVKGLGLAQNYILAHRWFNLAAAQGDAEALANRDHLARMMTPAQIAEAQRLAQEWKPTK